MEPGSESSSLKEFHPHSCLSAAWQNAGKRQAVFKPFWEEEEGRRVLRPQGDPCWRQRLMGLGAGPRDGEQDWDMAARRPWGLQSHQTPHGSMPQPPGGALWHPSSRRRRDAGVFPALRLRLG